MNAYAKHIYIYIDEFLVKDSLFHFAICNRNVMSSYNTFSLNTESRLAF